MILAQLPIIQALHHTCQGLTERFTSKNQVIKTGHTCTWCMQLELAFISSQAKPSWRPWSGVYRRQLTEAQSLSTDWKPDTPRSGHSYFLQPDIYHGEFAWGPTIACRLVKIGFSIGPFLDLIIPMIFFWPNGKRMFIEYQYWLQTLSFFNWQY